MLPTQRARPDHVVAAGPYERSTVPGIGWLLDNLRRRLPLIAALALAALVLGVLYTRLTPPMYEAGAMLRLETERANVPQLVEVAASDNAIRTEVEVMKGRSAAVAVIDSLGLRARIPEPEDVAVRTVLARVRIRQGADSGTFRFQRRGDGRFDVAREGTARVLSTLGIGDTAHVAGTELVLARGASRVPAFTLRVDPLAAAVDRVTSEVDISVPAREVDLIAVRARAREPQLAADMANLFARNAIASRQSFRRGLTDSAVTYLQLQSDSLGRQLRATEDSLRAYQQRENAVDVPQQGKEEVTRMAALRAGLAELRAERDAIASVVAQLGRDSAAVGGQSVARRLAGFPALLSSQSASVLLDALAQVENQRAQLLVRRTPADREVQALTERARGLEAQLRGIAQSYLQGLDEKASALEREERRFQTQLDQLPAKALETARLERSAKVLNDLYVLVQTRLKEAQAAGTARDPAMLRMVDSAVVPIRPVRPILAKNVGVALVLGLGLGLGAALLLAIADRSVRSRDDAERATGLPVLGALPRIPPAGARSIRRLGSGTLGRSLVDRGREEPSTVPPELLIAHPQAPPAYVEALNRLFATLAWGSTTPRARTLVVTSPLPGEGKTLTAVNLALLAASHGLRVLLVDGDLRRGQIGRTLGVRTAPGLSELLQRSAPDDEAIRPMESLDGDGRVDVLPAGARPRPAAGVVTLDRVRAVLARLAPRYDFVVIDSPPVNLLADASILGSAADLVLLVVRAGHTKADDLQYAIDQLGKMRATVAGTLLNDVARRGGAHNDASSQYMEEAARYG